MTGEEMKAELRGGGRVYGTMLTLARNPRWSRVLDGVGLDYAIVDTEHTPFGRAQVAGMIQSLTAIGVVPFVRIPFPSLHNVTMAMDAGAHGVLAPYCETAAQVSKVVGGAKWRPLKGALLERALATDEFPSQVSREYLEHRNRNSVVMIGIESAPAVERLEEILAVPGIDVVFVGPNDLSISLGVPDQYDHPRYVDTVASIVRVCEARGVATAIHHQNLAASRRWVEGGARCVLHITDGGALQRAYRDDFTALRELGTQLG